MSKKYVNEQNLQTAMTEYNDNSLNREVKDQYDRSVGTVSQVYDNTGHVALPSYYGTPESSIINPVVTTTSGAGEQVYAVVDNPEVPAEQVQEVTVLFRGSTAPDKIGTNPGDVWNDWIENDALLALRVWYQESKPSFLSNDRSTGQLKASSRALKDIMEKYPNAKINIYGHSLGSMDAQYSMADLSPENIKRIQKAYIYNGPNVYGILSDKQRETVDLIKDRIKNYADPKDMISMVGRKIEKGSDGSVGIVHFVESREVGFVGQHMTNGYQLDEKGNIILKTSTEMQPIKELVAIQLSAFERHKNTLASDGYSSNEKIFLDSEQSSIIASGLDSAAQAGLTRISLARNEAIMQMENFYDLSKTALETTCTALSAGEIETILISEGVSKTDIVEPLRSHFDAEVTKATAIATAFSNVRSDIESAIKKMTEEDAQLAGDFNQWSKI
ncbi:MULTISPECIES: cutinase family protein [Streptococcus]|nr:cutinase family protein [Streptococcus sanguinis]MBZ2073612.1 DUF2974 domain-containing protein [Streptococcus sanguinis]MBZ2081535.1 DUF2974 domain-containing protein [Streptococcus sanguinis]MCC3172839.1 hypothetical protein [Streptococcus sanguinis]